MGDDAPRPRGVPPVRKSLGQHFLNDRRILARIADAAGVHAGDTVVEIGPGRGALTELLLETGANVVAVEYDRALAELLRKKYAHARDLGK
jgi:16S rRNA (adenine1518-N6/adenine1519-N6)-dimethyltransferase